MCRILKRINRYSLFAAVFLFYLPLMVSIADTVGHNKIFIPMSKLKSTGINPNSFRITNLSADGGVLVGREKSPLKLIRKGFPNEILVFNLGSKGLLKTDIIPIPEADIDQMELNNSGTELAIEARNETDFYIVNFMKKTVTKIFHHVPRQPGFRGGPPVIRWMNGHFYFTGFFYNKGGITIQNVLARLDIKPRGKYAFREVINGDLLQHGLPGAAISWEYYPPDEAYFIVLAKTSKTQFTYALVATKIKRIPPNNHNHLTLQKTKMIILDHGLAFGGVAVSKNRILYSIKRGPTDRETLLKSFSFTPDKSMKTWKIGYNKPYTYLFISKNGKTIVVSLMNFKKTKMAMFYGLEKDNFKLKPIQELSNVAFGTFRFAPDGKHYAFLNKNGLIIGTLP